MSHLIVSDLLETLFSPAELLQLLRTLPPAYRAMAEQPELDQTQVSVRRLTGALDRRGMLDDAFFEAVRRARGRRRLDIDLAAERYREDVARTQRLASSPAQAPVRDRDLQAVPDHLRALALDKLARGRTLYPSHRNLARECFRDALRLVPGFGRAAFSEALTVFELRRDKDRSAAIALVQEALMLAAEGARLTREPFYRTLLVNLIGECHRALFLLQPDTSVEVRLEHARSALSSYERALQGDPNHLVPIANAIFVSAEVLRSGVSLSETDTRRFVDALLSGLRHMRRAAWSDHPSVRSRLAELTLGLEKLLPTDLVESPADRLELGFELKSLLRTSRAIAALDDLALQPPRLGELR